MTLDEVNQAVRDLITDRNQVVIMYAPDKETVALPSEQQMEDVILAAQQQKYAPYTEEALSDQLIDRQLPLTPGTIVSEKPWMHGFTELTLSNGMKVYAKQDRLQCRRRLAEMNGRGRHLALWRRRHPQLQHLPAVSPRPVWASRMPSRCARCSQASRSASARR